MIRGRENPTTENSRKAIELSYTSKGDMRRALVCKRARTSINLVCDLTARTLCSFHSLNVLRVELLSISMNQREKKNPHLEL